MLLSSLSFATSVDSTNAVTMLDYEQALNDDDARISLKNNTKELIKDICFNLTYIDMMGQTIDNDNYHKEVNLSPGETKTITLPAFKADEAYAYYRSVANNDQAKTFIVKFELKDYNTPSKLTENEDSVEASSKTTAPYHSNSGFFERWGPIAALGTAVLVAALFFGLLRSCGLFGNEKKAKCSPLDFNFLYHHSIFCAIIATGLRDRHLKRRVDCNEILSRMKANCGIR